jgi:protein transport protein SEC24
MIWLGGAVSPQIIDDLWGVENVEELDIRMVRFSSFVLREKG